MWQACARGSRQEALRVLLSIQPRDHPFHLAGHSLPAVARALVETLVFRPEARLLHAYKRAAFHRCQRPRDDRLRPRPEAIKDLEPSASCGILTDWSVNSSGPPKAL